MARLVLVAVTLFLALILASTAAYGVIYLPAYTNGVLAVGVAIVAVCGLLAISLLIVAFLLITRKTTSPE